MLEDDIKTIMKYISTKMKSCKQIESIISTPEFTEVYDFKNLSYSMFHKATRGKINV